MDSFQKYRPWFIAATVYNLFWGIIVSIWPNLLFDLLHIAQPSPPALMQCIGMMVGVYGIGYALIAKDPERYGAFVYVGLAGKILGSIGFLSSASSGGLAWAFGWVNLFNDIVWLPIFIPFAILVWKNDFKRRPNL